MTVYWTELYMTKYTGARATVMKLDPNLLQRRSHVQTAAARTVESWTVQVWWHRLGCERACSAERTCGVARTLEQLVGSVRTAQ